MKKNRFFIIVFLFLMNLSTAQEKQNDATLEETINWINQFGFAKAGDQNKPGNFGYAQTYSIKYNSSSNSLSYWLKSRNIDDHPNLEVKIKPTDNLRLILTKSNDKYGYQVMINPVEIKGYTWLYFGNNEDFARRVYKAFKHLFIILEWEIKCKDYTVSESKF